MKNALWVILLLGWAGCAASGPLLHKGNVARLEKGSTTQEEVLRLFGPPDEMSLDQDGEAVFTYVDIRARHSLWNYVPVFSFVHSEMKLTDQVLTIRFKENVIAEYVFSSQRSPQKLKYGLLS